MRYALTMPSKSPKPPAGPMNQWVRDVLEFANISQAELARRLQTLGIGNADRSVVNKMTFDRDISAREAEAISTATGYPQPAQKLTPDEQELLDLYREVHQDDRPHLKAVLRLAGSRSDRPSPPEGGNEDEG